MKTTIRQLRTKTGRGRRVVGPGSSGWPSESSSGTRINPVFLHLAIILVILLFIFGCSPAPQGGFEAKIKHLTRAGEANALWSECQLLMAKSTGFASLTASDPQLGNVIRRYKPTRVFVSSDKVLLAFDRESRRGIIATPRHQTNPPRESCHPLTDGLWYFDDWTAEGR